MKKYISSSELHKHSLDLARRICKSGWKPDAIIGLYRGGVYPAIVIEDYLRSKGIKTVHFPLRTSSYDPDKAESISRDVFVDDLPKDTRLLDWKRILIVDDICDTGASFAALAHKFIELSAAAGLKDGPEVRRATVAWKPGKHAIFKPHWWVKEYENDDWVVFPHEFVGLSQKELEEKKHRERN